MKSSDTGDFARQADMRIVPSGWIARPAGTRPQSAHPGEAPHRKWLTSLPSPLHSLREAALNALATMGSRVDCLEEAEGKVVIHSSLADCRIRSELTAIEPQTTRVGVSAMRGDEVDRTLSDEIVTAIERRLERSPALP